MTQITSPNTVQANWKTRVYAAGLLAGAVLGFISAYFFARAAEESPDRGEGVPKISTAQLLGLLLAVLGIIRQIAEAGRPPNKK